MTPLNESNFLLYAAANYVNTVYDTEEFYDDLKRFKYLKRLFSRYIEKGELKERLILNHIITLYNVFQHEAATRMLFYKIDEEHWNILKTFLLFLQYMPIRVENIHYDGCHIKSDMVSVDLKIAEVLRNI
tara:strand:- start:299 stop:688 length:390 start_codon:yes stop_codon:yes gene_type:complete